MSDFTHRRRQLRELRDAIGIEFGPDGYPSFVMPAEADGDQGERWVFVPKVTVVRQAEPPMRPAPCGNGVCTCQDGFCALREMFPVRSSEYGYA